MCWSSQFLSCLRRGWNFWAASLVPGKSPVIHFDKWSRKINALHRGHHVLSGIMNGQVGGKITVPSIQCTTERAPRVSRWSGRMIGGVWGMHSLIVKHYWWLLIVLSLRVSLACDYCQRVLVAKQGGEHILTNSCPISPLLLSELDGWLEYCSGLRRWFFFAKLCAWLIRSGRLNVFISRDGIGSF